MKNKKKRVYENERLINFFVFVEKIVFIIGIPLSILTYYTTSERDRKEKEFAEYNKLTEEYWNYELACTKFPLLGVSDATQSDPALVKYLKPENLLTNEERIIRRQMMSLSLSMYERAYLMYFYQCEELRKPEWEGWAIPLKKWANNKIFIDTWTAVGNQYDSRFQAYIKDSVLTNNHFLHTVHRIGM